jgi:ubiquinone/menaquinone biosynthesis C-methylase UbiE
MISIDEIIRFGHSMGLNEESKVLDLCCGYDEMLKILHEAFDIYGTGVDITSEFIDEGNDRLRSSNIKKVKLILGDILEYETNELFDVVILS